MTKKATKKSAQKAPRVKKAARARQVHVYTVLAKSPEDLSPQAATIVETIKSNGGTMTRPELLKALAKSLKTGQSASRVLSYYKKPLTSGKWLKVEKVAAVPVGTAAPAATPPSEAPAAPPPAPAAPAPAGVPSSPAAT
jgi:hypothetical protein